MRSPSLARQDDPEDVRRRVEYHLPRWCPEGLSKTQMHRVQRLRSLEQAEDEYLRLLKKARGIMQIPSLRPERNLI